MNYVIAALAVTNIVTFIFFLRAKHLNSQLTKYAPVLKQWLSIHLKIQRATGTMLMIKQVDEDSIMYREPTK